MTNELEKQFFQCFGIEAKEEKYCYWECKKPELENVACNNTECEHYRHKIHYPTITDTHYLKLICIISQKWDSFVILKGFNLDEFKREILLGLIRTKNKFYNQVHTLFEEG